MADDDAPAATTTSPFWLGNETSVQDDPLRRQAVGFEIPLNAHPPLRPTATTAVKSPRGPLGTRLTIRQDGPAGVPAIAGGAPVTASAAATPIAAPRKFRPGDLPDMRPPLTVPLWVIAGAAGRPS